MRIRRIFNATTLSFALIFSVPTAAIFGGIEYLTERNDKGKTHQEAKIEAYKTAGYSGLTYGGVGFIVGLFARRRRD